MCEKDTVIMILDDMHETDAPTKGTK